MATLSSLICGDLPPAGEVIDYRCASQLRPSCPDYQALWLNSGTAALSLAMIASRLDAKLTNPEVILPAYGCPDLVAAAKYAGVRVVLVDIADNYPGYNLQLLEKAISHNTVAVTAVNFLGIPERLNEITELLSGAPHISLIVDNAQSFPEQVSGSDLMGDYICLSFGRGKPISLLGGGALLAQHDTSQLLSHVDSPDQTGIELTLKYCLYNQLLNPFWYQFLSRNPFLGLGKTVYKPLDGIREMDKKRQSLLVGNIKVFNAKGRHTQHELSAFINNSNCNSLADLARHSESKNERLLRYPALCQDKQARDDLLDKLRQKGLGGSAMYQHPLIDIPNIASMVKNSADRFPAARDFADRLITLPVHSGVKDSHLQKLKTLISSKA